MGVPKPARHYNVSEIKSRLLNIAQTSLYQVTIFPPGSPEKPLDNFFSSIGRSIGFPDIDDIELLCSEASLPGSSLATHDVTNDYHGVTEKMAYRRIYDDTLDLTFYVDRDYKVIEFFDGWLNYIAGEGSRGDSGLDRSSFKDPYVNNRFIFPKEYKTDIYLVKFEKDKYTTGRVMNYTFVQAFPISIVSMPVSYEQSQLLKCTVSFSYIRYVRERDFIQVNPNIPNTKAPGVPELKQPTQKLGPAFGSDFEVAQNFPGISSSGVGEAVSNRRLTNYAGQPLF